MCSDIVQHIMTLIWPGYFIPGTCQIHGVVKKHQHTLAHEHVCGTFALIIRHERIHHHTCA